MKIRTIEQLDQVLDADLIWRKKELTAALFLLKSVGSPGEQRFLVRAGVALLYAHWEGFVLSASEAYLNFVANQRLKNRELSANFLALSARSLLRPAAHTDSVEAHIAVVQFLRGDADKRSSLPLKGAINTKSNLSSIVFHRVALSLGIPWRDFETKGQLIDQLLLARRNRIAHGEHLELAGSDYEELQEQVRQLLESWRTHIANAAALKAYRAGELAQDKSA